jgi:NADPH:quinone reductase-like Zn-dependent oxidoreductase
VTNCGNPLQVIDWPIPLNCGPKEVKVAVNFCGVNFADVYHVQGQLLQTTVPYVMGLECTGKVVEIGSDVQYINVSKH